MFFENMNTKIAFLIFKKILLFFATNLNFDLFLQNSRKIFGLGWKPKSMTQKTVDWKFFYLMQNFENNWSDFKDEK